MNIIDDADQKLLHSIEHIFECMQQEQDLDTNDYVLFLHAPGFAFPLVDWLQDLNADDYDEVLYSACLFALDVCVSQLKLLNDTGYPRIHKQIQDLMQTIASAMQTARHALHYWLPILNVFYDAQIELAPILKDAFLELATHEEKYMVNSEWSQLESIRSLILELADASVFDIADNFFAQSAAMPPDFFADLVMDLYSIDEGHEVAVLMLLHPQEIVRAVVVAAMDVVLPSLKLSSQSLSRLRAIKSWYPPEYHTKFDHWIKQQRKKGVTFAQEDPASIVKLNASEIDGSGAQGIFIQVKQERKNKLCGLLFKRNVGIKDAWCTIKLSAKDVAGYEREVFDEKVLLRPVDLAYVKQMTNHFLAETLAVQRVPDLYFLEIQELLGITFVPAALDTVQILESLSVQITPFTAERLAKALQQSVNWARKNQFLDAWYMENQRIDKWVNHCSAFVDGVKTCRAEEAIDLVLSEEMELMREQWLFHFVWVALWLKSGARKNANNWQSSALIAYAIHKSVPLSDIALMYFICQQSVINSIETMEDRLTYLQLR